LFEKAPGGLRTGSPPGLNRSQATDRRTSQPTASRSEEASR
jgi:hypothetical protein